MWALLDIRTGRANRAQFLLFILFVIVGFWIHKIIFQNQQEFDPKSYFSPYRLIFLLLVSYVFFLGMLRRYRDIGQLWPGVLSMIIVVSLILLSFTKVGYVFVMFFDAMLRFSSHNALVLGLPVLLIFSYALFLLPLLKHGDPEPNKYGYPPIGLWLSTMTAATYPEHLLKQQRDDANQRDLENAALEEAEIQKREAYYRENLKNRHTDISETQEFKGRA